MRIVFVILDTLHLMHDTTETLNEITGEPLIF